MIRTILTSPGHQRLQAEMAERRCARERLSRAIEAGLLAGGEVHSIEQEQARNQKRLEHLERHLARVEVIDVSNYSGNRVVGFGATVVVTDRTCGETRKWEIVVELEADAAEGRISIISPLARGLIGRSCGTVVNGATPGRGSVLEITEVEYV